MHNYHNISYNDQRYDRNVTCYYADSVIDPPCMCTSQYPIDNDQGQPVLVTTASTPCDFSRITQHKRLENYLKKLVYQYYLTTVECVYFNSIVFAVIFSITIIEMISAATDNSRQLTIHDNDVTRLSTSIRQILAQPASITCLQVSVFLCSFPAVLVAHLDLCERSMHTAYMMKAQSNTSWIFNWCVRRTC